MTLNPDQQELSHSQEGTPSTAWEHAWPDS